MSACLILNPKRFSPFPQPECLGPSEDNQLETTIGIHSTKGIHDLNPYPHSQNPIHVLFFASSAAMNLPESVSATLPEASDKADILPGLVEGSQLDRNGRGGWPIQTEPK